MINSDALRFPFVPWLSFLQFPKSINMSQWKILVCFMFLMNFLNATTYKAIPLATDDLEEKEAKASLQSDVLGLKRPLSNSNSQDLNVGDDAVLLHPAPLVIAKYTASTADIKKMSIRISQDSEFCIQLPDNFALIKHYQLRICYDNNQFVFLFVGAYQNNTPRLYMIESEKKAVSLDQSMEVIKFAKTIEKLRTKGFTIVPNTSDKQHNLFIGMKESEEWWIDQDLKDRKLFYQTLFDAHESVTGKIVINGSRFPVDSIFKTTGTGDDNQVTAYAMDTNNLIFIKRVGNRATLFRITNDSSTYWTCSINMSQTVVFMKGRDIFVGGFETRSDASTDNKMSLYLTLRKLF